MRTPSPKWRQARKSQARPYVETRQATIERQLSGKREAVLNGRIWKRQPTGSMMPLAGIRAKRDAHDMRGDQLTDPDRRKMRPFRMICGLPNKSWLSGIRDEIDQDIWAETDAWESAAANEHELWSEESDENLELMHRAAQIVDFR